MKGKNKIFWISRTAVFIALIIVWQIYSSYFASQIITGAGVNFLLILSVMTFGLPVGITVAVISPFIAKFFAIGPLWQIIPFISIGNIVIVLVWRYLGNLKLRNRYFSYAAALAAGAVCKFAVLYLGIVKLAVPFLLNLPEKQAAVISVMFSYTQIITASIGGGAALIVLPALIKIFKDSKPV